MHGQAHTHSHSHMQFVYGIVLPIRSVWVNKLLKLQWSPSPNVKAAPRKIAHFNHIHPRLYVERRFWHWKEGFRCCCVCVCGVSYISSVYGFCIIMWCIITKQIWKIISPNIHSLSFSLIMGLCLCAISMWLGVCVCVYAECFSNGSPKLLSN